MVSLIPTSHDASTLKLVVCFVDVDGTKDPTHILEEKGKIISPLKSIAIFFKPSESNPWPTPTKGKINLIIPTIRTHKT